MEIERESGWKLHPIGGETGQAFMGIRDEEKVFLKKNSSPFLAALSLEGISPRLMWTKRTGNGDVLTAQEWCNGRTLNEHEMKTGNIAKVLKKIHQSDILKRILRRVGGQEINGLHLIENYEEGLAIDLQKHPVLKQTYDQLLLKLPLDYTQDEVRVCHADISNDNMLLSDEGDLFIVDWDTAVLADYLFDIGQLFARFIEKEDWKKWLTKNEYNFNANEINRVTWYAYMNILLDIKYAHQKNRYNKMNQLILKLNRWLETEIN